MSKVGAYGHKEEKIARFDLYVILLCKVNTLFILVVSQVFQKEKEKKVSLKSLFYRMSISTDLLNSYLLFLLHSMI